MAELGNLPQRRRADRCDTAAEQNARALGLAGLGLAFVGGVNSRVSEDRLERAIWFYNRRLVADPGTRPNAAPNRAPADP